jgi:hypothetical protein
MYQLHSRALGTEHEKQYLHVLDLAARPLFDLLCILRSFVDRAEYDPEPVSRLRVELNANGRKLPVRVALQHGCGK